MTKAPQRMFSDAITGNVAFTSMSAPAQALYYQIGMHVDDDGFCGNPSMYFQCAHATKRHYQELLGKRYILSFDSGICVVKHHWINNAGLRHTKRYQLTTHQKEYALLVLDGEGNYHLRSSYITATEPQQNSPQKNLKEEKRKEQGDYPGRNSKPVENFGPVENRRAAIIAFQERTSRSC